MILIRYYAHMLRSRSSRGHRVQKIKVVGNSFLNTYPKKYFEYLAYPSSYIHFIVSIIPRNQLYNRGTTFLGSNDKAICILYHPWHNLYLNYSSRVADLEKGHYSWEKKSVCNMDFDWTKCFYLLHRRLSSYSLSDGGGFLGSCSTRLGSKFFYDNAFLY